MTVLYSVRIGFIKHFVAGLDYGTDKAEVSGK